MSKNPPPSNQLPIIGSSFRFSDAWTKWFESVSAVLSLVFTPPLTVSGVDGTKRVVLFSTNGVPRWEVGVSATPENGGLGGSDFIISRYDEAGAVATPMLTISRQTGALTFFVPTRPTITGSRAGNTGVTNELVQALAGYGLVTDGTGP